jgi:aspartyl-tRNA(Asn)/glutamyl-tRNA(Gln) amidotransferase subunit A
MTDTADLTAHELLTHYRAKTLSPVDAVKAAFDRIRRYDHAVNGFNFLDEAGALEAAAASEGRWMRGEPEGSLDGIPFTVKDITARKGWPTRRGSLSTEHDAPPDFDAPSVAGLLRHGAIPLGKTTVPEFGWKAVTDSPLTGITRNPWDLTKTPGGSSGGAAVAAALGMGPLHIGTDGGGSIRVPASFTGIVGLKPTYGRVPAYPASFFGDVAHHGPMTRSVKDAALMLWAMAEPDARDWQALPTEPDDYAAGIDAGVKGLRIGFSPNLGFAQVDAEVADIVAKAVETFASLGATVMPAGVTLQNPHTVFQAIWFGPASVVLSRLTPQQQERVDPGFRAVAGLGAQLSLADFIHAQQARAEMAHTLSTAFDRFDLLVTPATTCAAFPVGQNGPDPAAPDWTAWTSFSYPFNLSQQPAISIPCGFTRAGLPVGLQIVGPRLSEALILRAACAFEEVHPVRLPPKPAEQPAC